MLRLTLWIVTLLRVVLIPPVIYAALRAQEAARAGTDPDPFRYATIGLLAAMGTSDVIDGWLARRYSMTTQVGAVVDAVADKLVQVSLVAFFTLSVGPAFTALPLWFLVVVVARDLVLLVGAGVLRLRYGPIRVVHRSHGRVASVLVFMVIGGAALGLPSRLLVPFTVAVAAVAVGSATIYALEGVGQVRAEAPG